MKKKFTMLALLSFMCLSSLFAQIPTNGLIAFYPFNANGNDESGNANNGTMKGVSLVNDRFNNPSSAIYLDGTSNSYVTIPSTSLNSTFTNGQSISLWAKITSFPNDGKEHYLIDKTDNSGTPNVKFYQVFISDGVSQVSYRFANTATSSSQGNNIPYANISLNKWFHLCFVTDLSTTKTYIDGKLFLSYSHSATIGVTNNPLLFGATNYSPSTSSPYNGYLDDIRIYNRALDSTEIKFLCYESPCTNTIAIYDTTHVSVTDTTHLTITDTIHKTKIDTNYVTIKDTIHTQIFDTTHIAVTDTLFIDVTLTGVTPNSINILKVYPNPAKDFVYINTGNYTEMSGYTIKIENMQGQTVYSSQATQQLLQINLNDLGGTGLYFIKIYDSGNKLKETRKLILE